MCKGRDLMGEARRKNIYKWDKEVPEAFDKALEEKEVMWTLSMNDFEIRRGFFSLYGKNPFWDFDVNNKSYKRTRVLMRNNRFEIYGIYIFDYEDVLSNFLKDQNIEFELRNEFIYSTGIFLKNIADVIKFIEFILENDF